MPDSPCRHTACLSIVLLLAGEGNYPFRKRADSCACGTLVWMYDVDLLSEDVVRIYRASDPENPTTYRIRRGHRYYGVEIIG